MRIRSDGMSTLRYLQKHSYFLSLPSTEPSEYGQFSPIQGTQPHQHLVFFTFCYLEENSYHRFQKWFNLWLINPYQTTSYFILLKLTIMLVYISFEKRINISFKLIQVQLKNIYPIKLKLQNMEVLVYKHYDSKQHQSHSTIISDLLPPILADFYPAQMMNPSPPTVTGTGTVTLFCRPK